MEEKNLNEVLCTNSTVKVIQRNDEGKNSSLLKIKVYKRRWLILGLFLLYSATGSCQWIQYSIVTNIVTRYYGVSSLAVDWTSMSFMAYYVVFVFPLSYLVNNWGLRRIAILSSAGSCLGSWIKVFSVHPDRFYVTFIGHSLVGFSQIVTLTVPGRLSAQWFAASEVSTATSLGIFGTQLGISLSFLLTPMIVRNRDNLDDVGADLSYLFWGVAVISSIAFTLVFILFEDDPKLPPSETRALQKLNVNNKEENFLEIVKRLFKNQCYLLLCNTYGLNIGVLNAVATLLNQIYLIHFENGEQDAGRIGLAMIISGMAGSVSFGVILDKTHKFKETTVIVYFLSLCGQILFAVVTFLEIKWMVYLAAIFLGFFMSGYLALGYEICAEYTYPESEGVAAGILNVANNVYGIILVILLGSLLETYGDIPVHVGLCTSLLVGFIMTVLTKDEQRRQDAKKSARCEELIRFDRKVEDSGPEN